MMIRSFLLPVLLTLLLSLSVGVLANSADFLEDDKIKIELYYEAQCPGCRDTITRSFKAAYDAPAFLKMAEITLVPFGNAKVNGTSAPYSFECQHGPSECTYNIMEACALHKIKCPYAQFKFINCLENYDENREVDQNYDAVVTACATLTEISNVAEILTCSKGPEGNELEYAMATKTKDLSPAHKYVPWIVVDGTHDDATQQAVQDSLLDFVCQHYKGTTKSPACDGPSSTKEDLVEELMVYK